MMQVQLSVEGHTYATLQQKMDEAVQDFLVGAPEGTTATLSQIMPATKVGEDPSVVDGLIVSRPRFQLTYTWDIETPAEPPAGED